MQTTLIVVILGGAGQVAPQIPRTLHLAPRDTTLTLEDRSTELTLAERNRTLTLPEDRE